MAKGRSLFYQIGENKYSVFLAIFSILFLVRFYFSTFAFNNDFYNTVFWINSVKELGLDGFYSRNFSPWAQANYPPFSIFSYLYGDLLANFLFWPNLSTHLLASFYKLLSLILETILITYFITHVQRWMAVVVMLNPAVLYNTIFWGQTEGAITSLVFFSLLSIFKNRIVLGILLFVSALLIKQSAVVFLPVIALMVFKRGNITSIIASLLLSIILIWASFWPFSSGDWIHFPINFFLDTLGGQAHQQQASVNAFNLWYLLGFNEVSDKTLLGPLALHTWGQILAFSLVGGILSKLVRFSNSTLAQSLVAAGLINLSIFLFLTRIHERYLFPSLIFLLPLVFKNKYTKIAYGVLSLSHFLNLFWVWHLDRNMEVSELLTPSTTQFYSLVSIISFCYFLWVYMRLRR